jgi:hypothetical protein
MKKTNKTSKLYIFSHSRLPGDVHRGIQWTHVGVKLIRKYVGRINPEGASPKQSNLVADWADKDETLVVLDGGLTTSLRRIKRLVKKANLPWAEFREPDMGNMVTCIAVLVPGDFSYTGNFTLYDLFHTSKTVK